MRKTVFIFFILLGSAAGVLAALGEGTGLKLILGSIGAVAGAVIGGALSGIGHRRHRPVTDCDDKDGFTAIQDEQTRNYWLDQGRLTASPGLPHPDDNDPHGPKP